ncbi:MAG: hypothetical protein VYE22_34890 [Myxococcota bacterium]|nr:hypothetical protein [Myxococcota bacterium]
MSKKKAGLSQPKSEKSEDVALVCGATPDGGTLGVLRKRGDKVEAAVLKKTVEGQPVHGDLVRLKPREEPLLFDVESVYEAPASEAKAGPSQVASDSYRKGWDRLFRAKKRAALN